MSSSPNPWQWALVLVLITFKTELNILLTCLLCLPLQILKTRESIGPDGGSGDLNIGLRGENDDNITRNLTGVIPKRVSFRHAPQVKYAAEQPFFLLFICFLCRK